MKMTEASKRASVQWNKMNAEEKVRYFKLSQEDQLRFLRQVKEVVDKGFFIMDDGQKSCDVIVKKKRKATDHKPKMRDRGTQTIRIHEPITRDKGMQTIKTNVGKSKLRIIHKEEYFDDVIDCSATHSKKKAHAPKFGKRLTNFKVNNA